MNFWRALHLMLRNMDPFLKKNCELQRVLYKEKRLKTELAIERLGQQFRRDKRV